jgi:hypothetical protein
MHAGLTDVIGQRKQRVSPEAVESVQLRSAEYETSKTLIATVQCRKDRWSVANQLLL